VKYFSYVLINNNFSDLLAIIGHSCNCKIGNRVVGSHVATIIWYFSYAQCLEKILKPAEFLDKLFNIEEYYDDDDDDDY